MGKYHLGRHERPQLGFSWWVTFPSGHTTTFYDQEVIDNGRHYRVEKHLTDFWTDKAIEFIGQRRGAEEPFFLYLSYNGPYMLPPTVLFPPRNRHADRYRRKSAVDAARAHSSLPGGLGAGQEPDGRDR